MADQVIPRKFVLIGADDPDRYLAVADDGTAWHSFWNRTTRRIEWKQLPDLPPIIVKGDADVPF